MDFKRKFLLLLWLLSFGLSVHALARPQLSYVFKRKDSSTIIRIPQIAEADSKVQM